MSPCASYGHSIAHKAMCEKCQEETLGSGVLFDYVVCELLELCRHVGAESFRCLEIDDQHSAGFAPLRMRPIYAAERRNRSAVLLPKTAHRFRAIRGQDEAQ
jgi:hypothetical protein